MCPCRFTRTNRDDCGSVELEDDEIIPACTRAIASGKYKGEQLAKLLWSRGLSYKIKQEKLALADFTAAIRADPNYAAAYHARGDTYYLAPQLDLAIKDYSDASRLAPRDGGYYLSRAIACEAKGDRQRAIADYRSVLEIYPDNTDAAQALQKLSVKP